MKFTVICCLLCIPVERLNGQDHPFHPCSISEGDEKVIKFICNNNECPGMNNSKLENRSKLQCEAENIFILDQTADSSIVKLESLNITEIRIQSGPFNQTQRFIASENKLRTIPKMFFHSLPSLQQIDFRQNEFKTLTADMFDGAAALSYISFQHNQIETLESGVFSKLIDLNHLVLSGNRITKIDEYLFSSNAQLQTVCLKGNPLRKLNYNVLPPSVAADRLGISWSTIELLDVSCRQQLDCLFKGCN